MIAEPMGPPVTGGLLEALRAVAGTLHEILRVRSALFAVELREEVQRRKHMLVLAVVGATLLHMALMVTTLLVVVVFWDTHRIAAIGAVAVFYLGCGIVAFARLRAEVAQCPPPFAASLSELDRDLGQFGRLQ